MASASSGFPALGAQTRADICARQALGLSLFDKFVAQFLRLASALPPPSLDSMLPASPAASHALLSIATDTLCLKLTEALAFDMFQAAFALGYLAWPTEVEAKVQPCAMHPSTPEGMRLFRQLMASCERDVADWHMLEAMSDAAPDGARFDFLNEYGRHALTADDPIWKRDDYRAQVLSHIHGRMSTDCNPRAGPLEPSLLAPHLDEVLGSGHVLRSIVGSGSEAVLV